MGGCLARRGFTGVRFSVRRLPHHHPSRSQPSPRGTQTKHVGRKEAGRERGRGTPALGAGGERRGGGAWHGPRPQVRGPVLPSLTRHPRQHMLCVKINFVSSYLVCIARKGPYVCVSLRCQGAGLEGGHRAGGRERRGGGGGRGAPGNEENTQAYGPLRAIGHPLASREAGETQMVPRAVSRFALPGQIARLPD